MLGDWYELVVGAHRSQLGEPHSVMKHRLGAGVKKAGPR
jgi:hypothetical protein